MAKPSLVEVVYSPRHSSKMKPETRARRKVERAAKQAAKRAAEREARRVGQLEEKERKVREKAERKSLGLPTRHESSLPRDPRKVYDAAKKSSRPRKRGRGRNAGRNAGAATVSTSATATTTDTTAPPLERDAATLDYQIVVCRAFGMSLEQTAERICTAEFPEGMSPRAVTRRMESNAEWFKRQIDFCAGIRRLIVVREAKPLNKTSIKDEMESALGMSWANVYAEIENGNTELAVWCIEQLIGKPKQRSEVAVDARHAHAHELVWRPERKLLTEESEIDRSDRLLDVLPRDVVEAAEAELVGGNGNERGGSM